MKLSEALDQFDLENPVLPEIIARRALSSGDYPYQKKMKWADYEKSLFALQIELVKLQVHLKNSGERIIILFEGRDAAGKGGAIKRYTQNINPRNARVVALPKPSDREQMQWYFQRYVTHLPMTGETVLFDRSWYNRAVVEPVMGFCTPEQSKAFLNEAPNFERMLAKDGIRLFKFWLNISRPMQIKRFHDRRHDPLKSWKLSPVDLKALRHWDEYTAARDEMLARTHTDHAPWTLVRANDKRRARLAIIDHVLLHLDYEGRTRALVGKTDEKIIMSAPQFTKQLSEDE